MRPLLDWRLGERTKTIDSTTQKLSWLQIRYICQITCCVLRPANRCFAHHSMVEIIFFSILTSFLTKLRTRQHKDAEIPKKIILTSEQHANILFPGYADNPKISPIYVVREMLILSPKLPALNTAEYNTTQHSQSKYKTYILP